LIPIQTAKSRVFLPQAGYTDPDDPSMLPNTRPILEELPKWNVLSEIMDEIELEMYHAPHPEGIYPDTEEYHISPCAVLAIL
jgi:DNA excision repair protein ERCC-4